MKYKELVEQMSLEEKASLLSGKNFWESKPVERLNIPTLSMSDGPHGIRKQGENVDHLGLNKGLPATSFPTAAAVANSWDIKMAENIGVLLGEEAVAQKICVLLGPGLNIKRSPLCGRNFEYFSEDPYLSGKMAAAYIRGIQSNGIAACPKHFAVNNQELRRMSNDSILDERTLREIYLTGFEIAVKEGSARSIMTSYNLVNGVYANENKRLLRDILVDEWGFNGFVVTDWGGSNDHVEGIKAGSHIEMPAAGIHTDIEVVEAVKNGNLSMEMLNKRVDEFLQALFSLKTTKDLKGATFNENAHHDEARKAAEASIVLLKNKDNILPLQNNSKVAVVGDFAKTPRYQGAGSSMVTPTKMDNTLKCIEDSNLNMIGYAQGFERNGKENKILREEACSLSKKADFVLLYLGLDESSEVEGMDRTHMRIHKNQIHLLEELKKVTENIVIVLSCGSAVEMPWINNCAALLHASLSGQAGASAILNVLTGKVCPSGKLAESYPFCYKDTPAYEYFPGHENTSEYREGLYVGYRYYDTAAIPLQFPFGFGLSYTTFSYSDLAQDASFVEFNLTNTGSVTGAEVVQIYIGCQDGKIFRPKKELKAFAKVFLQAGESKRVHIDLDDKAFRYYNVKTNKFEIEGGTYEIFVASSSEDIRLKGNVSISGTNAPEPYNHSKLSNYYDGKIKNISDEVFAELLGHPIPPAKWDRNRPLGRNDTISQIFYAKGFLARLVFKIINRIKLNAEKKGKPDLNILYIYNIPFRAIAKMMNGSVDMNMVDSLLEMVNGHFFRGLKNLIRAWLKKRKSSKKFVRNLQNAKQEVK